MRDKKLILTTLMIFMFFGACAKKPESVLFNSPEQKYKVKNVKSKGGRSVNKAPKKRDDGLTHDCG